MGTSRFRDGWEGEGKGSEIEDALETSAMVGLLLEMAFSFLLLGSKHSSGNIGFGILRKLATSKGLRRLLEDWTNRQLLSKGAPLLPASPESPEGGASVALEGEQTILPPPMQSVLGCVKKKTTVQDGITYVKAPYQQTKT